MGSRVSKFENHVALSVASLKHNMLQTELQKILQLFVLLMQYLLVLFTACAVMCMLRVFFSAFVVCLCQSYSATYRPGIRTTSFESFSWCCVDADISCTYRKLS